MARVYEKPRKINLLSISSEHDPATQLIRKPSKKRKKGERERDGDWRRVKKRKDIHVKEGKTWMITPWRKEEYPTETTICPRAFDGPWRGGPIEP